MDDYDVYIDDLFVENHKPTGSEVRKIINEAIKKDRAATKTIKGLEIDVKDSWKDVLHADGSILYDYDEAGWKVMWYNIHSDGPGQGTLIRSWLSIRDTRHLAKEK
tara:strand:- start:130 stop:447 length:318 start_codon:yes stop_codon:yes gene_type:complete